MHKNRTGCDAS